MNKSCSEWERITTGVPQGLILGPLLFNIFLKDLFLFISDCSLNKNTDDNTLYTSEAILKKIKNNLCNNFEIWKSFDLRKLYGTEWKEMLFHEPWD